MKLNVLLLSVLIRHACGQNVESSAEKLSNGKSSEDLISLPTSYQFAYSTGSDSPAQIFREEQRSADGTVTGKYGYVDPNGQLRVITYRAGSGGFIASGDIGPDQETMRLASKLQSTDEATIKQNEVWNRKWSANWRTQHQNYNWNSYNPTQWNSQPPQSQRQPISQPLRPQSRQDVTRQWDDNLQSVYERSRNTASSGNAYGNTNWQNPNNWRTWDSRVNDWTPPPPIPYAGNFGQRTSWSTSISHGSTGNTQSNPSAPNNVPPSEPSRPSDDVPNIPDTPSRASIQKGWPEAPKPSDNPRLDTPFTYFSIDHGGTGNSPPFSYGYSY